MHRAGFSDCAGSGGSSAGSSSPCSSLASSPGPGQPPGTPGTPTPHGSLAIFSFALPSRQAKLAYKEQQLAIRGALEATAGMDAKQGATLATLEKGVLFPVVHVCDSGALFRRYLDTGRMLAEDAMGPDFALYQACYQEVRCIVPEGAELATPPFDQPDGPRDFLLLGPATSCCWASSPSRRASGRCWRTPGRTGRARATSTCSCPTCWAWSASPCTVSSSPTTCTSSSTWCWRGWAPPRAPAARAPPKRRICCSTTCSDFESDASRRTSRSTGR